MADLNEGASLPELTITPDKYLTVRYAGASGDFNPIHIDEQFAQGVGLPGRILHGLYTMALVARAHTEAAGGVDTLRRLKVQFRGMGFPEKELTVSGTVQEASAERIVVKSEVRQDGKAIIRNAEAELEPRASGSG
jgi:acyl dehydratase